jgi:anti-anti-sigma factor
MPDPQIQYQSPSQEPAATYPAPPPGFLWTRLVERGGSIRLVLAGELDLARRADFQLALNDAQGHSDRVRLDLGALTLIDCACLFVIFTAAERSRRKGTALILISPRGQVRRVLDLTGAPTGAIVSGRSDLPDDRPQVAA